MGEPALEDGRNDYRLAATLPVRVAWDGGAISGFSSNLSMGGAFIETNQRFRVATEVRLDFRLDDPAHTDRMLVLCRVERCIGPAEVSLTGTLCGIGISFSEFLIGKPTLHRFLDRNHPSAQHQAPPELVVVSTIGSGSPEDGGGPSDPAQSVRTSPRLLVGLPVIWGKTALSRSPGTLTDVNSDGTFVLRAAGLTEVGDQLHLSFEVPIDGIPKRVQATAKVVRKGSSVDAGVQIRFEGSGVDVATIRTFVLRRHFMERHLESEAPNEVRNWPK